MYIAFIICIYILFYISLVFCCILFENIVERMIIKLIIAICFIDFTTLLLLFVIYIHVNGKFEITRVIIYNVIISTSRLRVFTKIYKLYL